MPGYVIHLAVAKEYIRNFRVKNEDEFLKGSLAPDLLSTNDKKETHYTQSGSSDVNLRKFIKENKINNCYMEGYFLHLIVDYLFYNQYFPNHDKRLYNEYDITNKELIEKYSINVPEEIKDCVQFKDGELEILDKEKLFKMISEISKKRLNDYKKEIKQTGIATTNTKDIKLVTAQESKKEKIILALIIAALCFVMLLFVNQKEGYHCDEIFSFGSSNSAFNNKYWAYKQYAGINKLIRDEIVENKNIVESLKKIKYYFVDHLEEREKYEKAVLDELPERSWRTKEEAENYVKAQDNRFNYISVYYNQVQDVHPPLFYMLVHTVSSIFNNTFSKYIIFSINIVFFIGTCIFIWKTLKLLRKKNRSIFSSNIIWIKHWSNIYSHIYENVYDAHIFHNIILIHKYKYI